MAEERTIQQSADEFVTALVNTIGSGTVQEVVEMNRDDALDISKIAVNLPRHKVVPYPNTPKSKYKYNKED